MRNTGCKGDGSEMITRSDPRRPSIVPQTDPYSIAYALHRFTTDDTTMNRSSSQNSLSYGGELLRKGVHIAAMLLPLAFLLLDRRIGLGVLIFLSITAICLDTLRTRSKAIHRFFDVLFGSMMREQEREVYQKQVVLNGATWVMLSFTALVLLFPEPIAVLSYLAFMLGDALAALVGRPFGRHTWLPGASIEGSFTFFVSALAVGLLFSTYIVPFSTSALLVTMAIGTLLEALPLPINDNLVGPVGMGASLVLFSSLF